MPQRPVCGAVAVAAPVPAGFRLIAAAPHVKGTALLLATDSEASWSGLYRPFDGGVTELSPMVALTSAQAVWMAGTTLVVGRRGAGNTRSYELAPRATAWRDAGDPGCAGALTALGGGRALVVGAGCAAMYVTDRGWQAVPARPSGAREPAVLITLRDQRALALGRVGAANAKDPGAGATHVFDPATAKWVPLPAMPNPRVGPTVTLLTDGRVLVAGEAASIDILDPYAGHWTSQRVATAERHDHAAVALSDGRVLLLGGLIGDAADTPPTLVFDGTAWREAPPVTAMREAATAFALAGEPATVALTVGRPIDHRTFELYELGPTCATRPLGAGP